MIADIFLIVLALVSFGAQAYLVDKLMVTVETDWLGLYLGSCCFNLIWFQVLLYFLEMIAK